jgi:hypothetical protein
VFDRQPLDDEIAQKPQEQADRNVPCLLGTLTLEEGPGGEKLDKPKAVQYKYRQVVIFFLMTDERSQRWLPGSEPWWLQLSHPLNGDAARQAHGNPPTNQSCHFPGMRVCKRFSTLEKKDRDNQGKDPIFAASFPFQEIRCQ